MSDENFGVIMDRTKLPYVEEDNTRMKNYFILSGYAVLVILLIGVIFGSASVVDDGQPDMGIDVSLSDDEIPVRNSVEISVDIVNNGDAAGSGGVLELQKDGNQIMTEEIGEVEAGETKTISHEQEFEENGSFTISAVSRNGLELEDSETLTVRGDSYYAGVIENELKRADAIEVNTVRVGGETINVSLELAEVSGVGMASGVNSTVAAYAVAMDEGWDGMSRMEVREELGLVWKVESSWIESWLNGEIDKSEVVIRSMDTMERDVD